MGRRVIQVSRHDAGALRQLVFFLHQALRMPVSVIIVISVLLRQRGHA